MFLFTAVLVPGSYNYQRSLSRTNSAIYIYVCLLIILFLVNSSQLLDIVIGMVSAFSFDIGTELCIYTIRSEAFWTNSATYISVGLLLYLFLETSTQLLNAVIGMMSAFNLNSGT